MSLASLVPLPRKSHSKLFGDRESRIDVQSLEPPQPTARGRKRCSSRSRLAPRRVLVNALLARRVCTCYAQFLELLLPDAVSPHLTIDVRAFRSELDGFKESRAERGALDVGGQNVRGTRHSLSAMLYCIYGESALRAHGERYREYILGWIFAVINREPLKDLSGANKVFIFF